MRPSFPAARLQPEPEFNGVKCFYPSQHILVVLVPSVMMCLTSRLRAHISICVKCRDHMWPCAQKVHPATVFRLSPKWQGKMPLTGFTLTLCFWVSAPFGHQCRHLFAITKTISDQLLKMRPNWFSVNRPHVVRHARDSPLAWAR